MLKVQVAVYRCGWPQASDKSYQSSHKEVEFSSLMCSFIWSFAEMESLKAWSKLSGIKMEESFLSDSIESLNFEEMCFLTFSPTHYTSALTPQSC